MLSGIACGGAAKRRRETGSLYHQGLPPGQSKNAGRFCAGISGIRVGSRGQLAGHGLPARQAYRKSGLRPEPAPLAGRSVRSGFPPQHGGVRATGRSRLRHPRRVRRVPGRSPAAEDILPLQRSGRHEERNAGACAGNRAGRPVAVGACAGRFAGRVYVQSLCQL